MYLSNKIRSFRLSVMEGHTVLMAQEYPWCVLQVVIMSPTDFDRVVAILKKRGMVAVHDIDRTFCVIHLAYSDYDGQHPERNVHIDETNKDIVLEEIKDTMVQAVVWYYTNVIIEH